MPARCSGAKVRAKMAKAGMTAGKLVALTTLSESTINRILNDKTVYTSDYSLQRIADVLQCSPYDLLRDEVVEEAIKEASTLAVKEVVAEAVMEAVTAVTDEVAPDAEPDRVAEAVPPLPISPPPVLDVSTYLEYIKETTEARIAELNRSRNTWRAIAIAAVIAFLLSAAYFAWEIFNPGIGLSSVIEDVYRGVQ